MSLSFFERIKRSAYYHLLLKPYRVFFAPKVIDYLMKSNKFKKEIITAMSGGLGSQMWRYAIGRGAGLGSGLPVSYDLSWFKKYGKDDDGVHNRNYILENVFPNLEIKEATKRQIRLYRLNFNLYGNILYDYDDCLFNSPSPKYLEGAYVNAKYIDQQGDSLRDLFRFKLDLSSRNHASLALIHSVDNAVALHIRRGDYVGSWHDVATPRYFHKAVKFIASRLAPQRVTFFVFSNGMEWAKAMLRGLDERFVFVENNDNDNGAFDMYLMSCCKHFILSNSGFGWWAAWLSRRGVDKIVVMPDHWHIMEKPSDKSSMCVKDWFSIETK